MAKITIKELENIARVALKTTGMRDTDIEITLDHYLENEISGKSSHGMVRIVEAHKTFQKHKVSQTDPVINNDQGHLCTINAQGQTGPVAGHYAVQETITRAKIHGLSFVGITNYVLNSGSMAYYLRRLVDNNLIAIMGTNSYACVAPPGGKEPVVGTNPLGIGIPGENGDAMIADFGTAALAYGKMMVLRDQGKAIPDNVLLDKDGNPSNDINDAFDGAILPLAGHKGFALAMMIELLAGPLIGGTAKKRELYQGDGIFIIALDPAKLGNSAFTAAASAFFNEIKHSVRQPGVDIITLPGERSSQALEINKKSGSLEIADKTLENLINMSERKAA